MNFIEKAAQAGATDLHVSENGDAFMRCLGQMERLGFCTEDVYKSLEAYLMTDKTIVMKANQKVKDFSVTLPEVGRLRGRKYYSQGKACLALRFLPSDIPAPETLGWPLALYHLCDQRQGLVLVTGATGSGKTTTLAAMLETINKQRSCHIVTLESPVEYVFTSKQALIHQCAVPEDMESFSEGAVSLLRMDPDVIMVGELVDRETMRAVLKLAESGHLVFATMHTASVVDAIEYFINHFDSDEQLVIRHQLANVLKAVSAQRLLPHGTKQQYVAAYEVMLRNTAVVQQIKSGELSQLVNTIEVGRAEGMRMLEESLAALVKSGALNIEDALRAANEPSRLRKYMEGR